MPKLEIRQAVVSPDDLAEIDKSSHFNLDHSTFTKRPSLLQKTMLLGGFVVIMAGTAFSVGLVSLRQPRRVDGKFIREMDNEILAFESVSAVANDAPTAFEPYFDEDERIERELLADYSVFVKPYYQENGGPVEL